MDAEVEPEPIPAEMATLANPEPGVDPEPAEGVESIADPEPAAAGDFSESELQILEAWGGYSSEYVGDVEFLDAFGFQGTTIPDYFRDMTKWFMDGDLDRQALIGALEYLGYGAVGLGLGSFGVRMWCPDGGLCSYHPSSSTSKCESLIVLILARSDPGSPNPCPIRDRSRDGTTTRHARRDKAVHGNPGTSSSHTSRARILPL